MFHMFLIIKTFTFLHPFLVPIGGHPNKLRTPLRLRPLLDHPHFSSPLRAMQIGLKYKAYCDQVKILPMCLSLSFEYSDRSYLHWNPLLKLCFPMLAACYTLFILSNSKKGAFRMPISS